jgi:hypothetical protein
MRRSGNPKWLHESKLSLAMPQRQEDEKRRAEIEAAQQAAKKKSEEEASAKAEVERQRLTILQ